MVLFPKLDKGILSGIIRIFMVVQDASGKLVNPLFVAFDQEYISMFFQPLIGGHVPKEGKVVCMLVYRRQKEELFSLMDARI
jgi:hypothetical protein